MRILLVHNQYQAAGGEDVVFSREVALLREHGHEVTQYVVNNDDINNTSMVRLAINTIWSHRSYQEIRQLVRQTQAQVVHFHNTFPLISPAGYFAARAEGGVVVQTLHNWRLVCPGAMLFRDQKVCEDCIGKSLPWQGVAHGCYRQSRTATAVVTAMLWFHRVLGTWSRKVDVFIALSQFARDTFIKGGIDADKIVVKQHFVNSQPEQDSETPKEDYALFIGRLSYEKGIDTLLSAWRRVGERIPLRIVGDGPLADRVADDAKLVPGIEQRLVGVVHGGGNNPDLHALIKRAKFLILPSAWHEAFGLPVIEAFSFGTPVIGSKIGAIAELIDDGRTGLLFDPGDPDDLVARVEWALTHQKQLTKMGRMAREEYMLNYSAEKNYNLLIDIYEAAIKRSKNTKN